MARPILLALKEAYLLRSRLRLIIVLHQAFLQDPSGRVIHDLRVGSRRLREALDYLKPSLPEHVYQKMSLHARKLTRALGGTRESEVNLKIIENLILSNQFELISLEVMIYNERKKLNLLRRHASKAMKKIDFSMLDSFLSKIHGSRSLPLTNPQQLLKRAEAFSTLQLAASSSDEDLHQLRIHAKKFRYVLEIYNRLNALHLNRFILRLKKLQEILGNFHDLYVLEQSIQRRHKKWMQFELTEVPAALGRILFFIGERKKSLLKKVLPLYQELIASFQSFQIQIPSEPQSADPIKTDDDSTPP